MTTGDEAVTHHARGRSRLLRPDAALVAFALTLALSAALLALVAAPASANHEELTLLPYGSEWAFMQVEHGELEGFQDPESPVEATWAAGFAPFGNAPFGEETYPCGPEYERDQTHWELNTDLLLRRTVAVPPLAHDVLVHVAVDNDAEVWWDGIDISGGVQAHEGCASHDDIGPFEVPMELLGAGKHLLAIRAIDYGQANVFDAAVTSLGPAEGEAVTALSTTLSGGGESGAAITVPEGAAVSDSATLSGANAATAAGSVEYDVYSDSACSKLVGAAGSASVDGSAVPPSSVESLAPGTYYWQASYAGDSSHLPSKSACGSEVETVAAPYEPSPGLISSPAGGALAFSATVPAPQLAVSGNVAPVSGEVSIRLPGTSTFVALSALRQIPFGSVIDATHGRVSVTTAVPSGATQTGEFFEGEFVLRQGRDGLVLAELTGGDFAVCPTARQRSHFARASSTHTAAKHVVRKLWADAHGSFSTKGNYAVTTVEGTEWLTEDLCDGTYVRVTRDKVAVTNLVNHRHLMVTVGRHYLARAP